MVAAKEKIRPAVNELQIAMANRDNNAPINEREGDLGQARLERSDSKDFKAAIGDLGNREKIEGILKTLKADLKVAQDTLRGI